MKLDGASWIWPARWRGRGDRDRHPRRPRGPGGDPPRHGPRPGRGGAGAVPRDPGDHRPQCRGRLLLRLRPRRALLPGRPAGHRGAHAPDRRPRRADRPRGVGPGRGHRPLRGHRRGLQGPDHPRHSRRRADQRLSPGRLEGPVPGAAPALHAPRRQGVQADQAGRRLLARRSGQRPAPAHLRHRLGVGGRPGRLSQRGVEEAEKRDHRKIGRGHGSLPHPGRGQGHGLLAPQGLDALPHPAELCPAPHGGGGLCRGQDAPAARPVLVGALGPLGEVPRRHVHLRDGRGRGSGRQADELPGPRADLQPRPEILPRAADPHGRVRRPAPQRELRLAARRDAGARPVPGRRPHLLHRGADRGRIQGLRGSAAPDLRRPGGRTPLR